MTTLTINEKIKIKEIIDIIQENSPVSTVQTILKSRISVLYFEKLKPLVIKRSNDMVQYDEEEGLWYYVE